MTTIWVAVTRFFGPSHNDRFAALLKELAGVAIESAAHLRATNGQDLSGTITHEHRGDDIVDQIHELLDNSFILRFDKGDSMRLTEDLDNVIDGMRKVAMHIDIYKPFLATLRSEATDLIELGERMITAVGELIGMLSGPRLDVTRVRDVARAIDDDESEADRHLAAAERKLVTEFKPPGANHLEFLAWTKLYELLEQMTDDANHCGKQVLSLARKEA